MTRDEAIHLYNELIEKSPEIKRKGKTMPYTSANGHMFSLLNKNNQIGIRFSKKVQEQYLLEFDTTCFKSYGAVLKGYILIPESLLSDMDKLIMLLNEGFNYVMSLDPK